MGKRIPLLGGTYNSNAVINAAQRVVNLYPEVTPPENSPPTPVVHRLTPGLTLLNALSLGGYRGFYTATNGNLFVCFAGHLYGVDASYNFTDWGAMLPLATSRVSMSDNGLVGCIVDGTPGGGGWTFDLTTPGLTPIIDAAWYGADRVCFLDGFFIFNRPGTNQFYLSPPYWNGVDALDPTYIAAKTGGPDPISTIAVIHANLWLIGTRTSEVWFLSGAADFPFERQPGAFVDHGTASPYTVQEADVWVVWLSQDKTGKAVVLKAGADLAATRISNHALEEAMQGYATVGDAFSMWYQQGGHTFWVLTFPTANKTWVYDFATSQWHERESSGQRWRPNALAYAYNQVLAGDYANGALWKVSPDTFGEGAAGIIRLRCFPTLVNGGERLSYDAFIADMLVTQAAADAGSTISLEWSDDGGQNYGAAITIPLAGATPGGARSLIYRRLGMGRNRVFRLSWGFPFPTALQGAFIEVEKAET